jgi:hypothetical protein
MSLSHPVDSKQAKKVQNRINAIQKRYNVPFDYEKLEKRKTIWELRDQALKKKEK